MGLFKDFKEDFSQAVNELTPGGENLETKADKVVEKAAPSATATKASALDDLLEQVKEEPVRETKNEVKVEEKKMDTPIVERKAFTTEVSDETSIFTAGTSITGDIATTGSIELQGVVNGNVSCSGKLVVTGTINGNSSSSEFFADVAKIEGEVVSTGTVKVGAGSVIIGNISATSAVIAGAVKGDIDVQGPVVIDTSAVIMGNIKSRSVQINNGAVIEGFCSQAYSDVNIADLFAK